MSAMNRFVAGVLSVIAAGVLGIAYLLAFPRTAPPIVSPTAAPAMMLGAAPRVSQAFDAWGRPIAVSLDETWPTAGPSVYPLSASSMTNGLTMARPVAAVETVREVEVVNPAPRAVRSVARREPRRDWKKTALIIGGTTAAGAGIGGIVGGKKGALIGAAIGGGASTIYQTTR